MLRWWLVVLLIGVALAGCQPVEERETLTDEETIALFGVVYAGLVAALTIQRIFEVRRSAKRDEESAGVLGRFFKVQNRGHLLIIVAGAVGFGIGWLATASHMLVGLALTIPTVWVLVGASRRWLARTQIGRGESGR